MVTWNSERGEIMALLECPTRKDLPVYHYSISLDGVTYILYFKWNDRMSKWTLTLQDAGGTDLVTNIPLVANWPLFDRFKVTGLPPGSLFAYDSTLKNIDPGRYDLGDRVRLFYLEESGF